MLFSLALRNVGKSLPKRLAFGSFFAATLALLYLGNTVFENSDRGIADTYIKSFTGQLAVTAQSPEQFTIFGSDLPMIGEFLVLPVLPDPDKVRKALADQFPSAEVLTQVSAAGALALGNYSQGVPVFGVDFPAYFRFFPALKLVSGALPSSTSPSILITQIQADAMAQRLGRPLVPGEKLTISFAVNTAFVIREVTFSGTYSYPSTDALLDRIVLTDPDTARALNGYLYGGAEKVDLSQETKTLMDSDLGDLFSGASDQSVAGSASAVTPDSIAKAVAKVPGTVEKSGSVEGAWNFLLMKQSGVPDAELYKHVSKTLAGTDLQVMDWRQTAGGTAQISWFIRVIFNLGLVFIALVSCLILINSLSLSILERTREIGTMRALGAERSFVAGLIGWETLIVVVGTGLLGILVGVAATVVLDRLHLPLNNVYISSLFGSNVLHLEPSWTGLAAHVALSIGLGLASLVFPVRKALAIQPVKAIAREQ